MVTFWQHPRVYELSTGRLLHAWPELPTGLAEGCLVGHLDPPPPLALDPDGRSFAIAVDDAITVVQL